MKRSKIKTTALICLILGLLLTSGVLILGRYFLISDSLRGFLTGAGLAIEMIAIIQIDRSRKNPTCSA
jgi:hypothetical protein